MYNDKSNWIQTIEMDMQRNSFLTTSAVKKSGIGDAITTQMPTYTTD